MRNFMKHYGITILVDMCVFFFIGIALDRLGINSLLAEVVILTIALLIVERIRNIISNGKSNSMDNNGEK